MAQEVQLIVGRQARLGQAVGDGELEPGCVDHFPSTTPDTIDADLRGLPNTFTAGDVLANDTDPDGQSLVASGAGTVTVDGTDIGSYVVHADGGITVTLTGDGGRLLAPGATGDATLRYRAADPDGNLTPGTATLRLTGRAAGPIATADDVTWTLPNHAPGDPVTDQFSTDVLANDIDPDGTALTASGGGTWHLDGDPLSAGTFTVAPDGTLTMDSGTDPLGPVQQLRQGERWPATLGYTVAGGDGSSTGTVHVMVVGGIDQTVKLGSFTGPDGESLDFNDPTPTVFDGRGCYQDPEGYELQNSWEATSSSCCATRACSRARAWAAAS